MKGGTLQSLEESHRWVVASGSTRRGLGGVLISSEGGHSAYKRSRVRVQVDSHLVALDRSPAVGGHSGHRGPPSWYVVALGTDRVPRSGVEGGIANRGGGGEGPAEGATLDSGWVGEGGWGWGRDGGGGGKLVLCGVGVG